MVQIKKYSPNIEKLKTGGQTITGTAMGSEFAYQGFAELMNTSNEALKKGLDSINLAKDNLWITKQSAAFDEFALQYVNEKRLTWGDPSLNGFKDDVSENLDTKVNELMQGAPSDKAHSELQNKLILLKSGYVNKAFGHETKATTNQLIVDENKSLEKIIAGVKAGNGLTPDLMQNARDTIVSMYSKSDGIYRHPEEVAEKINEAMKRLIGAQLYAVTTDQGNKAISEVEWNIRKELTEKKDFYINLLDGDEDMYEDILYENINLFKKHETEKLKLNEQELSNDKRYFPPPFIEVINTIDEHPQNILSVPDKHKFENVANDLDPASKNAGLRFIKEYPLLKQNKLDVKPSDPYAIEMIKDKFNNAEDIRQELDIAYTNDAININDYIHWKNVYEWNTPGTNKNKKVLEINKSIEGKLKAVKNYSGLNERDVADIETDWSKQRIDKATTYLAEPEQMEEDFDKILLSYRINKAVINISKTRQKLPTVLTGKDISLVLAEKEGTQLQNGLVEFFVTLDSLTGQEQIDYLKTEGPKINYIVQQHEVYHDKKFDFNSLLMKENFKKIKEGTYKLQSRDSRIDDVSENPYFDTRDKEDEKMKMLSPYYLTIIDTANLIIDKVNVAPEGPVDFRQFQQQLDKDVDNIVDKDDISKDNLSKRHVKELLLNLIFEKRPDISGKGMKARPKITTGDNVDFLPMWTTVDARQKKYLNYILRKEQNYD